ncbi:MAG TPA: FlgD immunoglobulin-like domain containing protein, partial [Candidatus Saccharimonadales bacterium]|nr:FlgD immunoglobulin-like domain containing protein [Candidatus Saccharimonadales bacterium]
VGKHEFSFRDRTATQPATEYFYKVGYSETGAWVYSSPIRVVTPAAVFAIRGIAPNPTNGTTRVFYELARAGRATLEVYDLRGARVRTLLDGTVPAGVGTAVWDGRSETGRPLAAGSYFVRLRSEGKELSRRMVLLH